MAEPSNDLPASIIPDDQLDSVDLGTGPGETEAEGPTSETRPPPEGAAEEKAEAGGPSAQGETSTTAESETASSEDAISIQDTSKSADTTSNTITTPMDTKADTKSKPKGGSKVRAAAAMFDTSASSSAPTASRPLGPSKIPSPKKPSTATTSTSTSSTTSPSKTTSPVKTSTVSPTKPSTSPSKVTTSPSLASSSSSPFRSVATSSSGMRSFNLSPSKRLETPKALRPTTPKKADAADLGGHDADGDEVDLMGTPTPTRSRSAMSAAQQRPPLTDSAGLTGIEGTESISLDTAIPSAAEFSDVPLSAGGAGGAVPVPLERATSATHVDSELSTMASRAIDLSEPNRLGEPIVVHTAPIAGKDSSGRSFFSSASTALGFGLPSSSTSSTATGSDTLSPTVSRGDESRSSSSNWRSTMSSFLSRSASSTSPKPPTTPPRDTVPALPGSAVAASGGPSTSSFLLNRMNSPAASRDRRTSREAGGGEQRIREGFQRVRSEMEGAAREIRRERVEESAANEESEASGSTPGPGAGTGAEVAGGETAIDWGFWGAVVQDYEEMARTQPKNLSRAIQQGIPSVIRGAIWQLMSSSKSPDLEETYKALLKHQSPHEKAIAKDLSRTFPHHKFFQEGGGVGQESLFMVVKAYSLFDQDVGYTQGVAFIVAILLLNMPDEEAFCVLVRLMDSYNLRSHFLADMPGLQLRLFQFDRLLEDLLPLLHTHMVRKGVKSSMFASQWFMTLFSYRFPLPLVYRVLDIVFAEGIEAIFRFSLALLRRSEDALLQLEFEGILAHLQTDVFECYRVRSEPTTPATAVGVGNRSSAQAVGEKEAEGKMEATPSEDGSTADSAVETDPAHGEDGWLANKFVRDAYEMRITPFMLDQYEAEWDEQLRAQNKHALEVDQLRNANRNLSFQVKNLESSLAQMNSEHVEIVRQLVMLKIEKEETENELVRYKMLYAELAHAQQDAMSVHSRRSQTSLFSGDT